MNLTRSIILCTIALGNAMIMVNATREAGLGRGGAATVEDGVRTLARGQAGLGRGGADCIDHVDVDCYESTDCDPMTYADEQGTNYVAVCDKCDCVYIMSDGS